MVVSTKSHRSPVADAAAASASSGLACCVAALPVADVEIVPVVATRITAAANHARMRYGFMEAPYVASSPYRNSARCRDRLDVPCQRRRSPPEGQSAIFMPRIGLNGAATSRGAASARGETVCNSPPGAAL